MEELGGPLDSRYVTHTHLVLKAETQPAVNVSSLCKMFGRKRKEGEKGKKKKICRQFVSFALGFKAC